MLKTRETLGINCVLVNSLSDSAEGWKFNGWAKISLGIEIQQFHPVFIDLIKLDGETLLAIKSKYRRGIILDWSELKRCFYCRIGRRCAVRQETDCRSWRGEIFSPRIITAIKARLRCDDPINQIRGHPGTRWSTLGLVSWGSCGGKRLESSSCIPILEETSRLYNSLHGITSGFTVPFYANDHSRRNIRRIIHLSYFGWAL